MGIGRLFMEDEKMSYTWESQIETLMVNVNEPLVVSLMVRHCSPFNFVQGDPESIEGSPP